MLSFKLVKLSVEANETSYSCTARKNVSGVSKLLALVLSYVDLVLKKILKHGVVCFGTKWENATSFKVLLWL